MHSICSLSLIHSPPPPMLGGAWGRGLAASVRYTELAYFVNLLRLAVLIGRVSDICFRSSDTRGILACFC